MNSGRQLLASVGLILLCFAAYWPLMHAGYIWDDDVWLTNNPFVQHWSGLWYIWFAPQTSTQYYPLVYTAFLLQFKLWGLNPLGFHLVNIGLQAINAILLWRILRLMGLKSAWVAAAIWAIHPIQVETIGWVTEQKNLLSAAFGFGAALLWIKWAGLDMTKKVIGHRLQAIVGPNSMQLASSHRGYMTYILATILFVLALLAKTDICTLSAALLLIAWWKRGRITREQVFSVMPWFLFGAILASLTIYIEHGIAGAKGPAFAFSVSQRLIIAGKDLWFYPLKLLWPHPLLEIYPRWDVDHITPSDWLFPASAGAIPVLLWLLRKKIGRGPLTAAVYYGITISPVLGFESFYTMIYTFVADHYQYLASVGIIVFVVEAVANCFAWLNTHISAKPIEAFKSEFNPLRPARLLAGTASVLTLATLGCLAYIQSTLYNPPEKLWGHVLNYEKTSWQARLQLAAMEAANQDIMNAYQNMSKAIVQPGGQNLLCLEFLGLFYLDTAHDYSRAAELLGESLSMDPYQAEVICEIALCREKLGQTNQALADLERGLDLLPESVFLRRTLGEYLGKTGNYRAAVDQFQKALQNQPFDAASCYDLAVTWEKLGQWSEALVAYERALAIHPDWGEAQYLYGKLLLAHGQRVLALEHLKKAVELAPDQIDARMVLAQAFEESGDIQDARIERGVAMQIENQYMNAPASRIAPATTGP
ncbi:MAG TPA: tetratricopeptide repeat protein [Phycisphaerae bacterium]|nr:tetratricopeptide repeat protein [Phycisphaerae bacterium]